MTMKPCGKGHFFDDREHSTCPYCGIPLDIAETVGMTDPIPRRQPEAFPATRAAGTAGTPPRGDPEVTRHVWAKRLGGIDPVVGWLVCIEGPDKGRDYRIHTERNFIGRAPTMDIAIAGDAGISREHHAVISYNPKRHTFTVAPGDSRGLTYLNDDELLGPQPIKPYDTLELGVSKLLFVPFCGERFTWPVAEAAG